MNDHDPSVSIKSIFNESKWDKIYHYCYFKGGYCRIWKADFGSEFRWHLELFSLRMEMAGMADSMGDAKSQIEKWYQIIMEKADAKSSKSSSTEKSGR